MGGRCHSRARRTAAGVLLGAALACARTAPPPAPAPPEVAPAPPACERIVRIEIRKGDRTLRASCARGRVVTMAVALGRQPEGPKREAGDRRTPEGLYHVAGPAYPSRFHRFIPLDYPSRADADAALEAGRISREDHRRILRAHARGRMPPGDTPLGGGIGLHGEGRQWRGLSARMDWTYGCIAVRDADIDFLAERVERGTPVQIVPTSGITARTGE